MKQYRDEAWLREKYHEEGLTLQEMADECDVAVSAIHKWMERKGVERRSRAESLRRPGTTYYVDSAGYEAWSSHNYEGTKDNLRVHRLLAVAEYGFDAVAGRVVHHRNDIPWDNRPENIAVLTHNEHSAAHDEYADAPWRDEQTLIEAYEGSSINEIAEQWGCDQRTILTWMRRFGIARRSHSEAQQLRRTKESDGDDDEKAGGRSIIGGPDPDRTP